ncbi:hypothetical protein F66182_1718 [Fusarium sp. NRRL 66182]|nr:hypothetical protein F66182_1718 [Fusarium sp. NRRL 66182]
MAIQYLILLSRQGKVRLAKWFTTLSPKDKAKIVKDVSQLVLARRTRMCNFLEYKDTKIVYRRYASLFFIAGCSSEDNELITLEIIHRYVEQMDKYYGNVCELDIIFSFTKAYYILDEILLAGELQETSKKNVLRCIGQQDSLEDMEYRKMAQSLVSNLGRDWLKLSSALRSSHLGDPVADYSPPFFPSPAVPDSGDHLSTINPRLLSIHPFQSPSFPLSSTTNTNHRRLFSTIATDIIPIFYDTSRCTSCTFRNAITVPFRRRPTKDSTLTQSPPDCSLNQQSVASPQLQSSVSTARYIYRKTGASSPLNYQYEGSDKKLYKNIDNDLNSQHEALLKLGASLSPPERAHMLATSPSMQLFSHSSAFGPLSELSSRKTFAYLIATLNASHPHYDFSHVLRPNDFKRERNLRRVMVNLDSILQNVRPNFEPKSLGSSLGSEASSIWGPQCWSLIDKEMHLNECTIFSYHPDNDPFEEDESAIWAAHYFFFNRSLKRVAYLYVRVVPVISSHSPTLRPTNLARNHSNRQELESAGAQKRANYWLGDQDAELVPYNEDDEELDDGLFWNRGENGDLVAYSDEEFDNDVDDMDMLDRSPDRFMSEDIAGRMEI